jgi:hypothetical protein
MCNVCGLTEIPCINCGLTIIITVSYMKFAGNFAGYLNNLHFMLRKVTHLLATALVVLLPGLSRSQLTLTGTSYTQDFNGLPTLPVGWTVRTGASATALGMTSALTTNTWANTSSNFRNVAAAEPPLNALSSTADQTAAADRAIAVRPGSSFGDPGAAFVLEIANTTGKTDFNLSLKHMTFDNQTRTTVYTIEYTTTAAGNAGWTMLGTFTTGAFGATSASYSFGNALDNIGTTVWIRVRGNTSTGAGSRDTYGIDDVNLTWTNAPTCTGPTIAATTFSSSNITTTTADLVFSGGNGTSRVAFLKGSAFTTATPAANTTYIPDQVFTSGTSTAFDGGKTIYNNSANSVTVTSLTPNTLYNTKVFEYLGSTDTECYNTTPLLGSFTTLPTAAATIAASSITSTGFTANWTAPTGIGGAAYTYSIEVATDAGFTTPIAGSPFTVNSSTTSLAINSLSASTAYYYRVTIVNAAGNSAFSNITTVTTNAPLPPCAAPLVSGTPVTGTPTNSTIPGSFTASTGGADGYVVLVSTSATAPTLINGTVYSGGSLPGYTVVQDSSGLSFTASGLMPSTLYYIYVAAYNSNAGCSGGPAYASVVSTSAATAAGVVVPEADGDYRTATSGTWLNGTGTATWQLRTGGVWANSGIPSASYSSGKLIIRHSITAGTFASPRIAVDNGGTFIVNNTAATVSEMHVYNGGILQVNNALTLASGANFDVEMGGRVNINFAAATNTSAIWAGIENFKSGSIVDIRNWNYTSTARRLIAAPSQISSNAAGYLFGNLIFSGTPTAIFVLVDGSQTIKLTQNDFMVNNAAAGFNVAFSTAAASVELGGNLIVNTNQFSFNASSSSATITHIINGGIQVNGTAIVDLNQNSATATNTQVNLFGNLDVVPAAILRNSNSNNPTSSLNFVGANQNVDVRNGLTHGNFVFNINNGSVVNLLSDLTISNLTLTSGIFDLGTKSLTIVAPSAGNGIVSTGSTTSYVIGNLIRNTNSTAAYTFPVGKGNYAAITIQPSNANNSFSVHFKDDFMQTPNVTSLASPLTAVNATEWYDITRPTGTATATITLPWGPLSGVTDPATIVVAHYNSVSGLWESLGGSPTGTTTSGTVTVTGVSSFSPFAIGATSAAVQPLPIKLSAFTIQKEKSQARLNWTLETTDGNEITTLERSTDGKTFAALNTQAVAKANAVKQSHTDAAPIVGTNYYRLAITSGNGVVTYSQVLTATFGKEGLVSIYPNPARQTVRIDWTDAVTPATVEVRSLTGQLVWSQRVSGTAGTEVPATPLTSGSYIVIWKQGELVKRQQIQVIH